MLAGPKDKWLFSFNEVRKTWARTKLLQCVKRVLAKCYFLKLTWSLYVLYREYVHMDDKKLNRWMDSLTDV